MTAAKRRSHLAVGYILGPHGVRGELKIEVMTDFPQRFDPGSELWLEKEHRPLRVASVRPHNQLLLVRFEGLDDRSDVEGWHGLHLLVPRDQAMPLADGEYYADDLEGMSVITDKGVLLGEVVGVMWTGANEIYEVSGPFGELLLPAISDVVQSVDLQAGCIVVHLLHGLVQALDEEANEATSA